MNAKEIETAGKDVSGKEMLLRCTESTETRPGRGETNNVCFNLTPECSKMLIKLYSVKNNHSAVHKSIN